MKEKKKLNLGVKILRSGSIKLDGKMPFTVSMMLAFFASYAASSAISSTRNEPLKMFATTRPITQAMAVVQRK